MLERHSATVCVCSGSPCMICRDGHLQASLLLLHCLAAAMPGANTPWLRHAANRAQASSCVRRLYAWPADCPHPAQTLFETRSELYRSFAHPAVVTLLGDHLVEQRVLEATRCCMQVAVVWCKHAILCWVSKLHPGP